MVMVMKDPARSQGAEKPAGVQKHNAFRETLNKAEKRAFDGLPEDHKNFAVFLSGGFTREQKTEALWKMALEAMDERRAAAVAEAQLANDRLAMLTESRATAAEAEEAAVRAARYSLLKSNMKTLPTPEKFRGQREASAARHWLNRCESWFEAREAISGTADTEVFKVAMGHTRLADTAVTCWWDHEDLVKRSAGEKINTWAGFREWVLFHFEPTEPTPAPIISHPEPQVSQSRQFPGNDWAQEVEDAKTASDAAQQVNGKMSESDLADRFRGKVLENHPKQHVNGQHAGSDSTQRSNGKRSAKRSNGKNPGSDSTPYVNGKKAGNDSAQHAKGKKGGNDSTPQVEGRKSGNDSKQFPNDKKAGRDSKQFPNDKKAGRDPKQFPNDKKDGRDPQQFPNDKKDGRDPKQHPTDKKTGRDSSQRPNGKNAGNDSTPSAKATEPTGSSGPEKAPPAKKQPTADPNQYSGEWW